jgi:lipoyl(octanoyl) transferase
MFEIQDWGLIDYNKAWQKQKSLVADIQQNRNRNVLVLCEHPTVITIGRNGTDKNVLIKPDFLQSMVVGVINIDRGGDVTLHNPGQIVGYPIFDLMNYKQDLHWFLREVEDCIIELLLRYSVNSGRVEGMTGVWIENKRKICAMGFHCSRWVTSHGFALNVNNNLKEFDYIVPCGIKDKAVTSIAMEIGTPIDINIVKNDCTDVFKNHF